MIRLQRITTSDVAHYQFMEKLLINSFPPEEYRLLEELRTLTDQTPNFHVNLIFDNELPIGLITYWDFGRFYYVEHFATDPTLRNNGYGKRTLEHVCAHLAHPIVLEVERPLEEMAQRRINFYTRHGFTLWERTYNQPPYKTGDDFLPMYLMAYGDLDCQQDFDRVVRSIHSAVYGVKE